jgi:hypothetical protein
MQMIKTAGVVILAICLLTMIPSITLATPGASILYTETDLGGSLWQYDYTFYNTSTTEDLFSVFLFFDQETTFDWVHIPAGWDSVLNGFTPFAVESTDTFSTDTVNDIAPGSSLGLFSFTVDYRAGNIAYDAFLSDDNVVSGMTALVPEPVSSLLFLAGGSILTGRLYYRRKSRRIS